MKKAEYILLENNKVFMIYGQTKIDVTMAFKIGLSIGSKEYNDVIIEKL